MSSHLEIWKPSGRELITLSGQRVTVGQASTNLVSLKHDATVSRLHAVLENLGCAWSIRDVGSRNGTYLNGEKIAAERVLRSGDELRVGNSRLIFWEAKQADEASANEATVSVKTAQLPPRPRWHARFRICPGLRRGLSRMAPPLHRSLGPAFNTLAGLRCRTQTLPRS